ncbi:hypothetical protein B0A50_01373 [Salinomyces thailandicus]|uniref:Uncharacterized protein n=1 Tax=Salinomyces thailandicus TaxID=706561 RepID=A0A4U0UCT3_9PEZI|nr:hypothetical protein B0A50_01373 [Salinomyces thailandica]
MDYGSDVHETDDASVDGESRDEHASANTRGASASGSEYSEDEDSEDGDSGDDDSEDGEEDVLTSDESSPMPYTDGRMSPLDFIENLDPQLAQETIASLSVDGIHREGPQSSATGGLSDAMNHLQQASAYWSNVRNLGFGFDVPEEGTAKDLEEKQAETRIAGAPMQNEFFRPGDEEAPGGDTDGPDPAPTDVENVPLSPPPARGSRGGRGQRGGRRRGWKWALAGTEHDKQKQKADERARMKEARGDGRGRGKQRGQVRGRGSRGPRRPADPGREFKEHQTVATQAWMDGDLGRALDSARKAVQANPEVFAAHMLLSEILAKNNQEEDSIAALMSGANTKKDAGVWNQVAQRTTQLAGDVPSEQHRNQALFAYSNALKHARDDEQNQYIARSGKRDMSLELQNYQEARVQCSGMLRLRPLDMDNVRLYAELCAESGNIGEFWRAKEAYETAFNMVAQKGEDLGEPAEAWSHLNIYMEIVDRINSAATANAFFSRTENCQTAIVKLRRLARWILGRQGEAFWDEHVGDDREFDSSNERRAYVAEFQQGRTSRDKAQFGDGLPIELRVKLGLLRIKMGPTHYKEGLQHLDYLLVECDHVDQYYDIFVHVCDALRASRMWETALRFYEAVQDALDVTEEMFFIGMAECYAETGREGDAEGTYLSLIESNPRSALGRIELAKLYEKRGRKEEALPLIKEVMKLGRKDMIVKAKLLTRERTLREPKRPNTPKPPKAPKPPKPPKAPRPPKASKRKRTSGTQTSQENSLQDRSQEDGYRPLHVQYIMPKPTTSPLEPEARDAKRPKRSRVAESRLERMQMETPSVERHWETIHMHWDALEAGADKEAVSHWISSACALLETFCQMDVFFPAKKEKRYRKREFNGYVRTHRSWNDGTSESQMEANALFERLRNEKDEAQESEYLGTLSQAKILHPAVPREFHGFTFEEWQHLFIDLALWYARQAEQDKCYFILRNVLLRANVFAFDPQFNNITLATELCCALMFNDPNLVTDIGRKYITHGEYRAMMPFHLFAASSRLCYGETDFNAGPTQKFMARMIKNMDYPALPPDVRSVIDWGNSAPTLNRRLEKFGEGNEDLDAGVSMMYGHMLAMTQNTGSTGATSYYLRALALQPDSFSINLVLGFCYMHNAMKRQTDNRHYNVQQGLSFMQRYYELRTVSGKAGHVQEVEYNMAKTWHMLGLTHLAVPGYEKVLALSEDVRADRETKQTFEEDDFACEAAFALQQIFALAGNERAAQAITEQWLVL